MLPEAGSRGLFSLAGRPLPGLLAGNPVPGAAGSFAENEEPTPHLENAATATNPLPYREFSSTATNSRTLGMGRFLSPDPVTDRKLATANPQGWNRYSYVLNNPLRWTDPTGREIQYDDEFRKRVKSDSQFRQAFEAWKKTKSGAEQWTKMGGDTNTVYTFRVGTVKVMTGVMKEEEANAMTVPVVGPQNENRGGKLDVSKVVMTINADYIKKGSSATASSNIARAIFEEASHGLDIGSGTKSAREVYEAETRFHTATEPRMERFEQELKQVFSPDEN